MKIFLNLLPPERKAGMVKRFYWRYFLVQWFIVFLISLLALATMAALSLQVHLQGNQDQKGQPATKEISNETEYVKYEKKFEEANGLVKFANNFLSLHTSFSNVLSQIEISLPENVKIEKISTLNSQVFLTGSAENRDEYLQLQENIKANTCFEFLHTPLSNLFSETNVQFEIDFLVTNECLRGSIPKI